MTGRRRRKRAPRLLWDAWEDRVLRDGAGRMGVARLAATLLDQCGTVRTVQAIRHRLVRLQLSAVPVDLASTRSLSFQLGCDQSVISDWLRRGWLVCDRISDRPTSDALIARDAVERMIRAHPFLLDPARVRDARYRSLVELEQRTAGVVPSAVAASLLGVGGRRFRELMQRHQVPYLAGNVGRCGGTPRWWSRSAIHALVDARARARMVGAA